MKTNAYKTSYSHQNSIGAFDQKNKHKININAHHGMIFTIYSSIENVSICLYYDLKDT